MDDEVAGSIPAAPTSFPGCSIVVVRTHGVRVVRIRFPAPRQTEWRLSRHILFAHSRQASDCLRGFGIVALPSAKTMPTMPANLLAGCGVTALFP